MRLIDADPFGVVSFQGKSKDFIDGVCFILDKIYEAPTVEERPHGEWVQTYYSIDGVGASRFKCSKCENEISKYGKPYNFCPNCGASMIKKEGDEK